MDDPQHADSDLEINSESRKPETILSADACERLVESHGQYPPPREAEKASVGSIVRVHKLLGQGGSCPRFAWLDILVAVSPTTHATAQHSGLLISLRSLRAGVYACTVHGRIMVHFN